MKGKKCFILLKFVIFYNSCGYRCLSVASFLNHVKFKYKYIRGKEISFEDMREYFDMLGINSSSYEGFNLLSNSIYQVKYKDDFHFIYLIDKGYRKSLIYDPSKIFPFCFISNQKLKRKLTGYLCKIGAKFRKKRVLWYIIIQALKLISFILFIFVIKIIVSVI